MPRVIELKGGKIETLFSERDFAYLLRNTWVMKQADYFRSLMKELEQYREEGEEYDE